MYDVETKFKVNHICLLFAFIFSIMPIIAKRLQWCQVLFFLFSMIFQMMPVHMQSLTIFSRFWNISMLKNT